MQKESKVAFGNHQSESDQFYLNTISEAIDDIRQGKLVIVVDDESRENEGDFICAAECITPEIVNFMATHGRGLICTPIENELADKLELPLMVSQNTALHATAFTISIDLIGQGCTTGISAHDRAKTIKALVDPNISSRDFARPGHIFPLRAKSGGVLRRTGHTEAAIDLAKMAGFSPVGVLVEILNEDGTMARLPQLMEFSKKLGIKIISIKDLVAHRMSEERLIKKEASQKAQTPYGEFDIHAYRQINNGDVHLAMVKGDISNASPVLVRVHSSTETDDVLGSLLGNFNERITKSMQKIEANGSGIFLFMRHSDHEQSGDLVEELKLMVESANDKQGPLISARIQKDFGIGAQILNDLGATKIKLITSSPKRRVGLIGYGLEIVGHDPLF